MSALAKRGLVEGDRYRRVVLTKDGYGMALAVAEKHKTIERFFSKVLNLDDKTADTDACAIEHVISDRAIEAMRDFLSGYVREGGDTNGGNE
jgi:Mn-dependent DtxR family transcriptional regulator